MRPCSIAGDGAAGASGKSLAGCGARYAIIMRLRGGSSGRDDGAGVRACEGWDGQDLGLNLRACRGRGPFPPRFSSSALCPSGRSCEADANRDGAAGAVREVHTLTVGKRRISSRAVPISLQDAAAKAGSARGGGQASQDFPLRLRAYRGPPLSRRALRRRPAFHTARAEAAYDRDAATRGCGGIGEVARGVGGSVLLRGWKCRESLAGNPDAGATPHPRSRWGGAAGASGKWLAGGRGRAGLHQEVATRIAMGRRGGRGIGEVSRWEGGSGRPS